MVDEVLLDTDIGGDIDDALALAYLLKQPQCELLGITTVGGEPEKRAMLASALCHSVDRAEVPIHVGASAPLLVPERQTHAYQSEALSDQWTHRTFNKRNTAIEFLRDTIRAHPGEITLLTIGPLTNIGLLFALDPDIPALLKGLMMMGGCFSAKENDEEFNIICDPHAAAKIFAAPLELTSVGFDVTQQCRLDAAECHHRFTQGGKSLAFVAAMAEVFFRYEVPEIFFHDPLPTALIFEPSLCQTKACRIGVDLMNKQTLGRTRPITETDSIPHRVACSVEVTKFFEHYFSVVSS
ncbi:nucleoside hydrolase [bacterium]|nr:nucleoside hydrolase [bacterium]